MTKGLQKRFLILCIIFITVFLAINVKAVALQIFKRGALKEMAVKQHQKQLPANPTRGDIFDRSGEKLAVSIEVNSVYANPKEIDDIKEASRILSSILSISMPELTKKLSQPKGYVWIKRKITFKEAEEIQREKLPGVYLTKESRRFYPDKTLASHILGLSNIDSKGLSGIELKYDKFISGKPVSLTSEKDALGRYIFADGAKGIEPASKYDIVLTIDKRIQFIVEKELAEAVEKAGAKSGIAIVMNPFTGEILAMAIKPDFDPNNPSGFNMESMRIKGVTDTFEPGSTMKIFVASAGLEEKLFTTGTKINCENGSYSVGNKVIHDDHKHGVLTFNEVVKYSSNIGSAKIGFKLGREKLWEYLDKYGFGKPAGIDLPGEVSGWLHPYRKWSKIQQATICFGQGVTVTPIQLITALSAIANGGMLMKPYIVKGVVDRQKGEYVKKYGQMVVRKVISEQTSKTMKHIMKTVTEEGGTGTLAKVLGFEVAGKTGTSQKVDPKTKKYSSTKRIGTFIGFVPVDEPKLALLVSIDEPKGVKYGGVVAGPSFKKIAQQSLRLMSVSPDIEMKLNIASNQKERNENKVNPELTEWQIAAPDLTGLSLKETARRCSELKLKVKYEGSGIVYEQTPKANSPISKDGEMVVFLK